MRISDWSSDVCSSDLLGRLRRLVHDPRRNADDRCARRHFLDDDRVRADARVRSDGEWPAALGAGADHDAIAQRSDERRVGTESVITCSYPWSPSHLQNNNTHTSIIPQTNNTNKP